MPPVVMDNAGPLSASPPTHPHEQTRSCLCLFPLSNGDVLACVNAAKIKQPALTFPFGHTERSEWEQRESFTGIKKSERCKDKERTPEVKTIIFLLVFFFWVVAQHNADDNLSCFPVSVIWETSAQNMEQDSKPDKTAVLIYFFCKTRRSGDDSHTATFCTHTHNL